MADDVELITVKRFRIVVALDQSEYAQIVLDHALDQARHQRAPDLHFLTVVERDGDDVDDVKNALAELVLQGLDGCDCDEWRARMHVRAGRPHEEIASLAAELRANLMVIGRFGLHHPHRKLGTVASRVLAAAICPVLVVGPADSAVETVAQCPECVRVRAESDGERWFCTAHVAPDRETLATSILLPPPPFTGGGPMW